VIDHPYKPRVKHFDKTGLVERETYHLRASCVGPTPPNYIESCHRPTEHFDVRSHVLSLLRNQVGYIWIVNCYDSGREREHANSERGEEMHYRRGRDI